MNRILSVVSDRTEVMMGRKNAIKQLLAQPLFNEATEEIRRDIFVDWSDAKDVDEREALHMEMGLVAKFLGRLTAYANDVDFNKKEESDG